MLTGISLFDISFESKRLVKKGDLPNAEPDRAAARNLYPKNIALDGIDGTGFDPCLVKTFRAYANFRFVGR